MSLAPRFLPRRSPRRPSLPWTFAIVSVALFMVTLDNLVVTTALPSIRATSERRSSRWSGPSTRTR